jgi:hypothetical protein
MLKTTGIPVIEEHSSGKLPRENIYANAVHTAAFTKREQDPARQALPDP